MDVHEAEGSMGPPPVPLGSSSESEGKKRAREEERPPMRADDDGWGERDRLMEEGIRICVREDRLEDFVDGMIQIQSIFYPDLRTTFQDSSSRIRKPGADERHLDPSHQFDVSHVENLLEIFIDATMQGVKSFVEAFPKGKVVPSLLPEPKESSHVNGDFDNVKDEMAVQNAVRVVLDYAALIARTLRFGRPDIDLAGWVTMKTEIGESPIGFRGAKHDLETHVKLSRASLPAGASAAEWDEANRALMLPLEEEKKELLEATLTLSRLVEAGGLGSRAAAGDVKKLRLPSIETKPGVETKPDINNERAWEALVEEAKAKYEASWEEPENSQLKVPVWEPTEAEYYYHQWSRPSKVQPGSEMLAPSNDPPPLLGRVATSVKPIVSQPAAAAPTPSSKRARVIQSTSAASPAAKAKASPPSIRDLFQQAVFQALYHSLSAFFLTCSSFWYFGVREAKHAYCSQVMKPKPRRHGLENNDPLLTLALVLVGYHLLSLELALTRARTINTEVAEGEDGGDEDEDGGDDEREGLGGEHGSPSGGRGGWGGSGGSGGGGDGRGDGGGRGTGVGESLLGRGERSRGGGGGSAQGSSRVASLGEPDEAVGDAALASSASTILSSNELGKFIDMHGACLWLHYDIWNTPRPSLFTPGTRPLSPEPVHPQTPAAASSTSTTSSGGSSSTTSTASKSSTSSHTTASLGHEQPDKELPTSLGEQAVQEPLFVRAYEELASGEQHQVFRGEICQGPERSPVDFPVVAKLYNLGCPTQLAEFAAYEELHDLSGVPAVLGQLFSQKHGEALLVLSDEGDNLESQDETLSVTPELAREYKAALERIHDRGVAHCDIALRNLLLKDGAVSIVDFGYAVTKQSVDPAKFTKLKEADIRDLEECLSYAS